MKLTAKQIEYLTNERSIVKAIIESEPNKGLLAYHMKYTVFNTLIQLHNIAVQEERDNK